MSLKKEGIYITKGIYVKKLESESVSSSYTSENNFDTESTCMSLSCCLRALDNVEGTKKAWSPNRQTEMGV